MVMRENLYGFQGNQKSPYLKVTVTDPRSINWVRTAIEEGNANYKGLWKAADGQVLTFDSIQYVLRFMIDCKVRPLKMTQLHLFIFGRFKACPGLKFRRPSTR